MQTYLVYTLASGLPVQLSAGIDAQSVLAGFDAGFGAVAVGPDVSDLTHYVNAQGDAAPFPAPGKPWERFDRASGTWIDTRPLSTMKIAKLAEITAALALANQADITLLGRTFKADKDSQDELYRAAQLGVMNQVDGQAYTVDWPLANDTLQTLTLAQLKGVIRAIGARTDANRSKAAGLRAQIRAADAATIGGITWT